MVNYKNIPSGIIHIAERHVRDLLHEKLPGIRKYHNIAHTIRVVEKCSEISVHENLPEEDTEGLLLAAWFHDTGYVYGTIEHENLSAEIATQFLKESSVTDILVASVCRAILATKLPTRPKTRIEKILCDADMQHLGAADFKQQSDLLKRERELETKVVIDEMTWNRVNISFLKQHAYFTTYARTTWENQKQINLLHIMNQVQSSETK